MAYGRSRRESSLRTRAALHSTTLAASARSESGGESANSAMRGETFCCWNGGVRLPVRESDLFVGWDPVDLFFDRAFIGEAATLEDGFAVFDHFGVSADVCDGVVGRQIPVIGVFAEDVVG